MDAAEHFALGEQALNNAGETLDARETEGFIALATAHFQGGLLAFFLDGQGEPALTDAEVQARHHPAVRFLIRALQNDRSSADDTAEDPDETITHKGVDA